MIVKENPGAIYRLPLFHHFGKEGYDIVTESGVDGNLIRRKIVEHFGWPGNPEEQLRSETQQEFRIQKDGAITLTKERTANFYFYGYVE